MNFTNFKALCAESSVFVHNGLSDENGKKFDKCKLTGARCMRAKCPGFNKHVEHTDMLQSKESTFKEAPIDVYHLRGQYEEEIIKGE